MVIPIPFFRTWRSLIRRPVRAAVNALMIYDLAKRAERHGDPYENLEAMYRFAEVSWVKGDFDFMKRGLIRPVDIDGRMTFRTSMADVGTILEAQE